MSAAPPRAPFRGLNALYARTLAVDAGGDELALTYDFAGNILRQELTNDGTDTTALRYTHDAWNRLVKVEFEDDEEDVHPRGEYEYNGLNWRTVARADSDTNNSTHALDELRSMYYSHEWRLLEVRVDANYQSSPGVNSHIQHVWGERYIDDIVSTRLDPDPSVEDGYETVQFHVTDAQFSTVAMLSSAAAVLERVTYSAYGVARHHWLSDVDGDGDVDSADVALVNAGIGKAIGDVGYRSEFDLNRDGSITLADRGLMSAASALPEGVLSSAPVGNRIGYCGYVFAPETQSYLVRFRWYLPPLGRWGQRDPAGYVDGMNLYEYARGAACTLRDPLGLAVYWCARDLDQCVWGNHHFLLIIPDKPDDFAPYELIDLYGSNRGFILGAYESFGCLRFRRNHPTDVAATREYHDSDRYKRSDERYKRGWSTECHLIPTPDGMSDTELIRALERLARNYHNNTNCAPGACPKYDLIDRNCATWVNQILKAAGYSAKSRRRLGEFRGIDWAEEDETIDDALFECDQCAPSGGDRR